MEKYAVFGDSYVERLRIFCHGRLDIDRPVEFFGERGMGTRQKFDHKFQELLEYRPSVVLMILGGNSIRLEKNGDQIFADIVNITEDLYASGVRKVPVVSIVERGRFPQWTGLSHRDFNISRRYINKKLKLHFCGDFVELGRRLQYPKHYCSDLAHPGKEEGGLSLLMKEVTKAFRKTLPPRT